MPDQRIFRHTDDAGSCPAPQNYLIYDGECPFCSRYVRYTRAKAAFNGIILIDARERPDLVLKWQRDGFDLNEGMILVVDENTFFGGDAVHALALASTSSGTWNKVNAAIFRSKTASKIMYPAMRCGRNLALRLLGRPKL